MLNFEAGGTSGPATILQTSSGNAWLMQDVQAAVPAARGSSLTAEVFRRMPNNTDLTILKRAGLAGLDFAFAGHGERYHTPEDDVAHLDPSSLQEQGHYALALTRRFGSDLLGRPHAATDDVFFTTRLTDLIAYPASWAWPLAWLAGIGLLSALAAAWRRRPRGLWIGGPLALVVLLAFGTASVPGTSYLVEWPLLAAIAAFALLVTAPQVLGVGWRLVTMMLGAAAPFLIVVAIVPPVYTGLISRPDAVGPRAAALPFLIAGSLLSIVTLLPQLVVILRRTR